MDVYWHDFWKYNLPRWVFAWGAGCCRVMEHKWDEEDVLAGEQPAYNVGTTMEKKVTMWGVGSPTQGDSPSSLRKVPIRRQGQHWVSDSEWDEEIIHWVWECKGQWLSTGCWNICGVRRAFAEVKRQWISGELVMFRGTNQISKYIKNNGSHVYHCQRKKLQIRKGKN